MTTQKLQNLFKNIPSVLGLFILIPLLFLLLIVGSFSNDRARITTEQEALNHIYQQFPEFNSTESEQTVFYEEVGYIWYVTIGFGGNGQPILSGQCFEVEPNKVITRRQMTSRAAIVNTINPITCEGY